LSVRLVAVAQSATESQYEDNLAELGRSDFYQSDVRSWFEQKWIPNHEASYFSCAVVFGYNF